MKNSSLLAAVLFFGIIIADLCLAGPPGLEQSWHQAQVLEQLNKALGAETTDAGKFAHLTRVMKEERYVSLRRRILDIATRRPGPELEKFLTDLLAREEDSGIRSQAATTLGLAGSEKCLTTLAHVARKDPTTSFEDGCFGGQSNARREATFAIAELTGRFPQLADEAAAILRALPVVEDPKDNEQLADARAQALFQITQDKALLKPFYERLRSKDAKSRASGVIAFRFLKMKDAPAEILNAIKDMNVDVRSWSALVLGEIGDSKTSAALMRVAADTKEEASVRCNAIYALGRMRTAVAEKLLEKLLTDPDPRVPGNAAVALYRITGKKVKQFPEGYNAD
jgi:HEAT repeat protein